MITSSQNPKIQQVRALLNRRQERESARLFVVEGVRLTEEAQFAGWRPQLVMHSSGLSDRGQNLLGKFSQQSVEIEEIAPHLMEAIAGTQAPQGILAIFPYPAVILPAHLDYILIADNVRDPGNLGTLLRTAAAAGVQAVLLAPGTTDAFSPKVVRSAMGAHFRLQILSCGWETIQEICQPVRVYLAEAGQGKPYWQFDLRQPLALVIGSEAEGPGAQAHALAHDRISIPMPGGFESLNAAVAAGILIFEIVRQRNT